MTGLSRNVRFALRVTRRSPGFSLAVVVVLGLSIGADTALFGLLDAVFWRPLPVPHPERIVSVVSTGTDGGVSYPDYLEFRAEAPSLEGLLVFTADSVSPASPGTGEPSTSFAYGVSADYFDVLGVTTPLGRGFDSRAEASGGAAEVVLSDLFWRRRFGADPGVLGRGVTANGVPLQIVGVAPPGFTGTQRGAAPDFWVPLTAGVVRTDLESRRARGLLAVGRLRAGASTASAAAELRVVARRLAAEYPESNARATWVAVVPEREALFRQAPGLGWLNGLLLGLGALVLVIACLNLAILLAARSTFRRRELGVRAALGATRGQIAAQLLAESALLAVAGGAAGLALATVSRGALLAWLREVTGFHGLWIDTAPDPRLLVYAAGATLGTVLLFGLVPALRGAAESPEGLADEGAPVHGGAPLATPSRRLLALQVAASVLLLSCAGLLVQSVRRLARLEPGYPLDGTWVVTVPLGSLGPHAPDEEGRSARDEIVEEAAERLRRAPGVLAVGLAAGPAGQRGWPGYLPASEFQDPNARRNVVFTEVGPGFFEALGVPLLEGRDFDARDRRGAPKVAILNRLLAERLWPGQPAAGRLLRVWSGEPPLQVVGVVETANAMPISPPWPTIHLPLAQHDHDQLAIHVRAPSLPPERALALVAGVLRETDPALASHAPESLREAQGRFYAILDGVVTAFALVGGMALLLSAVGLYGLTSFVVGRRVREIGIRRTLGATGPSIYALIVGGTFRTVGLGLVAGVAASLAVGLAIERVLLRSAWEPSALIVAPCLLAATAVAAASLPALRGCRLDPMRVLREL